MSIRRVCAVLGAGRSSYHYAARRPSQAVLSQRIREIAETRVRYGYRRIHVLLRREGWQVNVKRIYRLYTEEGLQLRHKTPKRRVAAKLRGDRSPPAAPNQVWAMDFLSDQLFNGRRIRILTIVDAYSRLSPAIDVRPHYRGTDVVETLERVTRVYGTPKTIRLDNGPEFISKALDLWAWLNGVTLDFSRPGKPTDNAFIESFNGSFAAATSPARLWCSGDPIRARRQRAASGMRSRRPRWFMQRKRPTYTGSRRKRWIPQDGQGCGPWLRVSKEAATLKACWDRWGRGRGVRADPVDRGAVQRPLAGPLASGKAVSWRGPGVIDQREHLDAKGFSRRAISGSQNR